MKTAELKTMEDFKLRTKIAHRIKAEIEAGNIKDVFYGGGIRPAFKLAADVLAGTEDGMKFVRAVKEYREDVDATLDDMFPKSRGMVP